MIWHGIVVIWHDLLDKVTTRAAVFCVLKARYLILRETIKKSIPVIEPCTNACIICSAALWFKYFLIRLIFLIWNDDTRTMLEIWGFRVIVESNITPKFRACDEGIICESPIVINGRETFDAWFVGSTWNYFSSQSVGFSKSTDNMSFEVGVSIAAETFCSKVKRIYFLRINW